MKINNEMFRIRYKIKIRLDITISRKKKKKNKKNKKTKKLKDFFFND